MENGFSRMTLMANPETISFDTVLTNMLKAGDGVSDLLFVVGRPPQVEVFGKLRPVDVPGFMPALQPAHTQGIAAKLVGDNERLKVDLKNNGSCDTSYAVPNVARFRVNVFRQNGNFGIVMRKLSTQIPTCEGLKLPAYVQGDRARKRQVSSLSPARPGSGKTTTLAAMLNELNMTSEIHMVTLEDPIEFMHPHLKATFSQRELGRDFSDFATGLRAALRQAPKVILVGEIATARPWRSRSPRRKPALWFLRRCTPSAPHSPSTASSACSPMTRRSKSASVWRTHSLRDQPASCAEKRTADGSSSRKSWAATCALARPCCSGSQDIRNFHEIIEANVQNGWHSFEQSLIDHFKNNRITEETDDALQREQAGDAEGPRLGEEGDVPR
jgi:twitching motility protein PilT